MRWFREVGKPSFLGTLKEKDLMSAIQDWIKKKAEWVKEQKHPTENWAVPVTGEDVAKQRTMLFRVDTFMRAAITPVAEGVFP
jgi:hypothetical protein